MQISGTSSLLPRGVSLAALSLLLLRLVGVGFGNDGGRGRAGSPAPLADGGVVRARAPIVGATVTAYKAGTSGYDLGAVVLATTKSDSHGNYSFAAASCNTGDLIYYVASGGDAGAGVNPAIVLMSEVGTCGALPGFVVINEVHTVAAAYALAQFIGKSRPYLVGAPESNAIGISNAFATVGNLVKVNGGGALGLTPGGGRVPQRNLNTLANALAGCVNSSGADSAECSELFACARPGASFATTCSGGSGATPADTLGAALNVALNPASVSRAGLFAAAAAQPVFLPELTSTPHDWTMPLNYAQPAAHFNAPFGVAIDGAGHIWVTNLAGSANGGGSVTALNNDGSVRGNFAPPGANFNRPYAVAIDGGGHIWVTNGAGDSVTALNNDGSLRGNFAPPGANFIAPNGVAIDGAGHVWVANGTGGSVTALNNDGSLFGNFAPSGANFNGPSDVAIDRAGHVWVANSGDRSVTALNNDGSLYGNFAPPGANFNSPSAVAIDSGGHVWAPNYFDSSVTALNNDGSLYGNFAPPGANFNDPLGVAIDSAGHVWVANVYGNGLTALNNDGSLYGNFDPPGANFNYPYGVAIDGAGNVWSGNDAGANRVTELVGAASPVRTPLAPGGPVKP